MGLVALRNPYIVGIDQNRREILSDGRRRQREIKRNRESLDGQC